MKNPADLISFRGHNFIFDGGAPGFGFSFAMRDVCLYTKQDYAKALSEEKPNADQIRPLQRRDLTMVENIFGKECPKTANLQAQAIIDTLGLKSRTDAIYTGAYYTTTGFKQPEGLLLSLERVIGRFDDISSFGDSNEDVEVAQGNTVIEFLGLNTQLPTRTKPDSFYQDPLALIRALRTAVKSVH